MDNITHTLLGVAMARSGLQRTYGRGTTTVLAVASNLCDVDIFSVFADTSTAILMRRTISHSVFGVPVLCFVAAYFFQRVYPHFQFRVLLWLCLLGASVHVFFDWLNAYGVALLSPLASHRFEAGVLFVTDPFLIGALLLPRTITALLKNSQSALSSEVAWRIGLALVVVYVGFCAWNREVASVSLAHYAAQKSLQAQESYVVPEPLGPHRWSGILRVGNSYQVMFIHSLSGDMERSRMVDSMLEDPSVSRIREDANAVWVEHLFKAPVWEAKGDMVIARDLRFSYHVLQNEWDPFRFRFKITENHVELQEWTFREILSEMNRFMHNLGSASSVSLEALPTSTYPEALKHDY